MPVIPDLSEELYILQSTFVKIILFTLPTISLNGKLGPEKKNDLPKVMSLMLSDRDDGPA